MVKYLLKRLVLMIITLFVIVSATFFLMNSMPGNPVRAQAKKLPEAVLKNMEVKYGLDKPITERYVLYLKSLVKGDLGDSFVTPGLGVSEIIKDRFPASARIGIQSVLLGLIVGVLLGIIAGFRRNTAIDYCRLV